MTRREITMLAVGLFAGAALVGSVVALNGDRAEDDPPAPAPMLGGPNVVAVERGQGEARTGVVEMAADWELRWTARKAPDWIIVFREDPAGEMQEVLQSYGMRDPSGSMAIGEPGRYQVRVVVDDGAPWKAEFIQHSGRIE